MRAPLRLHAVVLGAVAALVLSACGGGGDDTGSEQEGNGPVKGGTITFLTIQDQIQHLDPLEHLVAAQLHDLGRHRRAALAGSAIRVVAAAANARQDGRDRKRESRPASRPRHAAEPRRSTARRVSCSGRARSHHDVVMHPIRAKTQRKRDRPVLVPMTWPGARCKV